MDALRWYLERAQGTRPGSVRPCVTLSYAQSLDGSIAIHRSSPFALSCSEALELTHRLRAVNDAILVGIGTLLADDPRLTVRLVQGEDPQPIVLDSRLRTPVNAELLQASTRPVWIATTEEADPQRASDLEAAGAQVIHLPADAHGRVHLPGLLDLLGELGIGRLMVEGGAQVITGFMAQALVDWVVVTIAPMFIGGQRAVETLLERPTPEAISPGSIHQATRSFPRLHAVRFEQVGDDLVVWGRVR